MKKITIGKAVFFICLAMLLSAIAQTAIKAHKDISAFGYIYVVNKQTEYVMVESRYAKLSRVKFNIVNEKVICEWVTPERKQMSYPMSVEAVIIRSDTPMPRWIKLAGDDLIGGAK
jgi:hypothetical protein